MIVIQLLGGLGNQMFQYACGRALGYKFQTKLIFDTSQLSIRKNISGITIRSLELDIFNLDIQEANKDELKKIKPFLYKIVNVLAIKIGLHGIRTSKYFIEKDFSYSSSIEKVVNNCYLSGYWQSFRYFQNIESLIRHEFIFSKDLDKRNQDIVNKIKNENSVSVHLRHTDFVDNKFHDIHGTCSLEYYNKAIEYITGNVKTPFFFIFSDDIKWAQENLKLSYKSEFISGNTGKESYIDMQLMSLCKHNIIANSSFSWWGAWLNSNPDKIVIAPIQWFTTETLNARTVDLIPEAWIRL